MAKKNLFLQQLVKQQPEWGVSGVETKLRNPKNLRVSGLRGHCAQRIEQLGSCLGPIPFCFSSVSLPFVVALVVPDP
jgi:hypothetical protein